MGFQLGLAVFVFASTLAASFMPGVIVRGCGRSAQRAVDIIASGSALSAGIILGALLCHLLPEAGESFERWNAGREAEGKAPNHYPLVGAICGAVCLVLVAVDGLILHRLASHGGAGGGHGHSHGTDHVTDGLRTLSLAAAQHARAQGADRRGEDDDDEQTGSSDVRGRPLRIELPGMAANCDGGARQGGGHTAGEAVVTPPTPLFASSGGGGGGSRDEGATLLHQGETDVVALAVEPAAGGLNNLGAAPSGSASASSSSASSATTAAVVPLVDDVLVVTDDDSELPRSHGTRVAVAGGADPGPDGLSALPPLSPSSSETRKAVVRAWILFAAMSLHGVFDGLSVGNNSSGDMSGTALAVASHKVFDGIALGSALYPAPLPPRQRAALLTLSALTTPLGMAIGAAAEAVSEGATDHLVNGIFLSAAAGSFVYITFMELLPSCVADGRRVGLKYSLVALGFLAMALLALRGE